MDSSVWIDFLSSRPGPAGAELRMLIQTSAPIALTGIVVTEVLQGIRRDLAAIEKYLDLFEILDPLGVSTYKSAAAIHRSARARGFSLTTVDAVIAAIALDHRAEIFTLDKDFGRIAGFSGLRVHALAL